MISKSILSLIAFLTFSVNVHAQSKTQVVQILTNAECGKCEKIIESKLNYIKGVSYADLDVSTKVLEIKFNSKHINLEELKQHISDLGYDADDVVAREDKQKLLPACCQPGGMTNKK